MDRRDFLKWSGLGLAAKPSLSAPREVALEIGKDPIAQSAPVQWAIGELKKEVTVRDDAPVRVSISGEPGPKFESVEAYQIVPSENRLALYAHDVRGMVYAITELAQRGASISAWLSGEPANPVRSVTRCFVSDVEDKPW